MKILLSVFSCGPGFGSEPGVGWHWAVELGRLGHEVVALTNPRYQTEIEAQVSRRPPATRAELRVLYAALACPPARFRPRLGFVSLTEHLLHLMWQALAYCFAKSASRATVRLRPPPDLWRHPPSDLYGGAAFSARARAAGWRRAGTAGAAPGPALGRLAQGSSPRPAYLADPLRSDHACGPARRRW